MKVYSILTIPSHLYACEIWTMKQTDIGLKDRREEIHETQSRMQFIRTYKKWRNFRTWCRQAKINWHSINKTG